MEQLENIKPCPKSQKSLGEGKEHPPFAGRFIPILLPGLPEEFLRSSPSGDPAPAVPHIWSTSQLFLAFFPHERELPARGIPAWDIPDNRGFPSGRGWSIPRDWAELPASLWGEKGEFLPFDPFPLLGWTWKGWEKGTRAGRS